MRKKNIKGVTFVELLATISIIGIIIVPISSVFYIGFKNYFMENEKMTANEKANEILDKIIEDLRKHENIHTFVNEETNDAIYIKDNINYPLDTVIYNYLRDEKKLYRNDVYLQDDLTTIENFYVEELQEETYDSSIINISLSVKFKRVFSEVETSYRRKY